MTLSAQTSRKQTNHSKTGKSVSHRRLCVLLALAILLVLVAGTGLLYQALASAVDASRYPPPGRLVDRGGYRLHLHCSGTSRASRPLVLLDAGLGGSSLDWSLVQPGVATFTRVCSYDRAGYGWSDAGPEPRTSGRLVSELHMLLVNAGVPGPYVLVGHSFGGLTMRLFASTYPQEVAGLVLVDSSHEEDPTARQEILSGQPQLSTCSGLAPFGIVRLFGLLDHFASAYPSAVQPVVKAHFSQTRFCGTWDDESAAWGESTAQVRAARTHHKLGNLPLVVITHGKRLDASWQAFQNDLANLSSRSTHLMATRSGHAIMLDQPDLVSAAIKEVVTRVEKHRADLALSYLANLAMTYWLIQTFDESNR
jgi:pimeloyl-ACP methyl ester carboxylesterase